MTEANGHVIDPDGEARMVLDGAVAEHGPGALSDPALMGEICQARLSHLRGEAVLIGSAARSDVPALLRDLIPKLGNYGAIQSVASTLAGAHGLNRTASAWVVREFARALGLVPGGGTQPTVRISSGQGQTPPPARAGGGAPRGNGRPGRGAAGGSPAPGSSAGPAGPAAPGGSAAPGGAGRSGEPARPDVPAGMKEGAGATPPGRPPSRSRLLRRNTVGVAAAVALAAAYLGVAAAAHLSPFPAKTVAVTSSPPPSRPGRTSPAPDRSPDRSPASDYQILLTKIPRSVQGQGNCRDAGTSSGASAVTQCASLRGLAAGAIIYYLFSDDNALDSGFASLLRTEKFRKQSQCTNSNSRFTGFVAQCQSGFANAAPHITGSVAEYTNTDNDPIIVSTDDRQRVMAVMVGRNDGDLLAYWKQMQWVVS